MVRAWTFMTMEALFSIKLMEMVLRFCINIPKGRKVAFSTTYTINIDLNWRIDELWMLLFRGIFTIGELPTAFSFLFVYLFICIVFSSSVIFLLKGLANFAERQRRMHVHNSELNPVAMNRER